MILVQKCSAACVIVLSALMAAAIAAPASAASEQPKAVSSLSAFGNLVDRGVVTDVTRTENERDWYPDQPDTPVVFVPGTGDDGFVDRTAGRAGARDSYSVVYPESFGPVVTGNHEGSRLTAPTYDESVEIGTEATVEVFREIRGEGSPYQGAVLYDGYSQGSEILGNAAEQAYSEGLLSEQDRIYLNSDPSGPWAIETRLQDTPAKSAARAMGVTLDGRNPADTGDEAQVTSVIRTSDPVANFQWQDDKPVESLGVTAAGFLLVHGSKSEQNYDNAMEGDAWENATHYYSAEGNTEYVVIEDDHPFTLAEAEVLNSAGIVPPVEYTDSRNEFYNEYVFEMSMPNVENSAVTVE
ncbi:MAG: hypothetical protein ACTJG2_03330 [Candidatus Saccharimonadales bacterium]